MRLDYFRFVMKRERTFWDITETYTLFTEDWELYNNKTKEGKEYKKLENVLDVVIEGKTIKQRIKELDKMPELIYGGGRGAGSGGNKTFSFGGAGSERGGGFSSSIPPAKANVKIKQKDYQSALNNFKKNHLLSGREWAYEVDDNGYVYQYKKGQRSSVNIGSTGKKPRGVTTMIIHNHPKHGWSAFSDADLISTANDTKSKGIVATSKKYDYTMRKTGHFKAKAFVNAVRNAKMKGADYDDAVDNWMKANQKKYGYTYNRKKN